MDVTAALKTLGIVIAIIGTVFLIFSVIMIVAISWTHTTKGRKKK